VEFSQHQRVAPIRFDSITRLHWDERRRHHHAFMAKAGQLTV
jgi:hypothetical protein